MAPKIYHFYNLPAIMPTLQKDRTTVEWTSAKRKQHYIFVWYAQQHVLILWWLVLNEETEQITMLTCLEHRQEAWGYSYAQTHTTRHTYIYTRVHALVPCTNIINNMHITQTSVVVYSVFRKEFCHSKELQTHAMFTMHIFRQMSGHAQLLF